MRVMPLNGEIFSKLEEIYWERSCRLGPASLNDLEAAVAFIRAFQLEMNNGGFWAFFTNSTGWFARDTPRALRFVQAHKSARLLDLAIPIYLGDRNASQFEQITEWNRWIAERDGDSTPEADDLQKLFSKADEPLLDLLEAAESTAVGQLRLLEDEAVVAQYLEGTWRQCAQCSDAWEHPIAAPFAFCPSCGSFTALRVAPSS